MTPGHDTHATALLWEGEQDFRAIQVPLPELAAGECIVRITTATVCGSDLHSVQGRRSSPSPSILGHEGVGIVLATAGARSVSGKLLQPCDRVVFSVIAHCGQCARCQAGRTAKCLSLRKTGHEAFTSDWALSGTYASHIVLRPGQAIVHAPASLSNEVAATAGCAVATVMAAAEAAGSVAGQTVALTGLGMLGLVAVAVAHHSGAARIYAADPAPQRQRWARSIAPTVHAAAHLPAGLEVDHAWDFSGAPGAVADCLNSLGIGGTAVLVGSVAPAAAVAVDAEAIVRGWHTIAGVHNYEPRHLQQAVDFLTATATTVAWAEFFAPPVGLIDLPDVLTHTPTHPRTPVVM